jgi:hypothetical protein
MTTPAVPTSAALRADFRHLIDGELVRSPLSFARRPEATRAQGKPLARARDEIGLKSDMEAHAVSLLHG